MKLQIDERTQLALARGLCKNLVPYESEVQTDIDNQPNGLPNSPTNVSIRRAAAEILADGIRDLNEIFTGVIEW